VSAGDLMLTLEAMKLEHAVLAPEAGLVAELYVEPGTQVEAGTPLALLTPDEPSNQPSDEPQDEPQDEGEQR
jgi:propionyl-CoA carboxylase alpha chain